MTILGLVLTGGGARAAYQVGALQALAEIADLDATPFRVLTGVSAGAINAGYLAAHAENFRAVLLNAVFLDSLDADLELLERINQAITLIPHAERVRMPHQLRPIPTLALRPSKDLGRLAADQYDNFPRMLRYLLRGIGATGASWDLLSYLAFEPGSIDRLLELGHAETLARRAEILEFLT